jgi:hypothetical protein
VALLGSRVSLFNFGLNGKKQSLSELLVTRHGLYYKYFEVWTRFYSKPCTRSDASNDSQYSRQFLERRNFFVLSSSKLEHCFGVQIQIAMFNNMFQSSMLPHFTRTPILVFEQQSIQTESLHMWVIDATLLNFSTHPVNAPTKHRTATAFIEMRKEFLQRPILTSSFVQTLLPSHRRNGCYQQRRYYCVSFTFISSRSTAMSQL